MQEQVGVSLGCSRRGVWRDTTAPTWTSSCFCSGLPPRGREAGALKQQHSGHSVNGAAIHTQLTAAACDGQPVAPGGSSLGAKMGLLSGDRDEGRRTHGAPTRTPSPMKALVGAGASARCLNVQPVHRTASPSSSDARVAATGNLLSTRHCGICDAGEPQCPSVPVCQTELTLEGSAWGGLPGGMLGRLSLSCAPRAASLPGANESRTALHGNLEP